MLDLFCYTCRSQHAEGGEDDDPGIEDGEVPGTAPKRPLSPFIFYSQDARRIIKKENPGMHSKLIMKQVQKNWRAMTEEQKEYYKEQSKQNRNEYEERRRTFEGQKWRST